MKKTVFIFVAIMLMCSPLFAVCEYTGKAENVSTNDRGVTFTVVVTDCEAKEVLRRDQWVSTGVMTGQQAVDAVKNVVDKMTQEMWAHKEGAKEVLQSRSFLEAYSAKCSAFSDPQTRPNPQDAR